MSVSLPAAPLFRRGMSASPTLVTRFLALAGLAAALLAAPAHAAPFAYVALSGTNKVAFMDMATGNVVNEIVVGSAPYGIAVSQSGRYAYVTNIVSNDISVIDTQTNTVVDSIIHSAASSQLRNIAVHPNGTRLYTTDFLGGEGTLSVFDAATKLSLARIPLFHAQNIAVDRSGTFAYASQGDPTRSGPGTLAMIDLSNNSIVATIPVNVGGNIEFSPNGLTAYAVTMTGIAVIDTIGRKQTALWRDTEHNTWTPTALTLSSDGSRLYTISGRDKTMSTFDTSTGEALSRITFGSEPSGLAVANQRAIVASKVDSIVSTVDLLTNQVVKVTPVGQGPLINGSVVLASQPVAESSSGGGGGGCGFISGSGGRPDPTLPGLVILAIMMIAMRGRRTLR